ncbi:hypothetical protein H9660_11985 [Clostridium sp. Sa3CUN1]|uniref:Uncharacterized protein n=1 Tax=Clostridium gallinarum TaxID=2762246 RepID=A0ABR8Q6F7_9CLOT|nr:hypothetical protein [Clostridium gallinarum]MBD7915864.1 hypothetical protein [Clostridium gallinarum]
MVEPIRVDRDTKEKLNLLIVEKGLHKLRVKIVNITSMVVKDWIKDPVLDKEKIIKNKKIRAERVNVDLTKEEKDKLYEIYVRYYQREVNSVSALIYNIINQYVESEFEKLKCD